MSLIENRIKYQDTLREVVDKMNLILDEIIEAVGDYPSLKEYIEGLTGGVKGTVTASPEGVVVAHNFDTMDYQVVTTAADNVNVWRTKELNTVTIYASETAQVDYAIMSTTDALRLVRDNQDTVQEVVEARNGFPSLNAYLKELEKRVPQGVSIQRHIIKAVDNQSVVTLPNGAKYVPGTNTMTVFVDGVKQRSNLDFSELSTTQIRFTESLMRDWSVELLWYDFTPVNVTSHANRHGLGGGDEISLHGTQIVDRTIPDKALESSYVKLIRMPSTPTTGNWKVGDMVYHSAPTPGGFLGWVCTTAGEYGTWNNEPVWKPFGLISQ